MLKVWAIKNKSDGTYFSANGTSSSAPTIYLSKGKAKGRGKQLYRDYEVVEWTITATAVKSH